MLKFHQHQVNMQDYSSSIVHCTEYGNFFQEKFETWARVCWLLLISVWKQAGNKLRWALSPPLNASLLPILYKLIYRPVVASRPSTHLGPKFVTHFSQKKTNVSAFWTQKVGKKHKKFYLWDFDTAKNEFIVFTQRQYMFKCLLLFSSFGARRMSEFIRKRL